MAQFEPGSAAPNYYLSDDQFVPDFRDESFERRTSA
jgi:hypothetical protein